MNEEHCPYCGVYLSPGHLLESQASQKEGLYAPPYSLDADHGDSHAPPPPPYEQQYEETFEERHEAGQEEQTAQGSDLMQGVLIPLASLLGGSAFFLFGIVLWLFSQNGTLTLQWSGNYWYFYLAGGAALLLIGWRALNNLED